jgi:hypothetical protein
VNTSKKKIRFDIRQIEPSNFLKSSLKCVDPVILLKNFYGKFVAEGTASCIHSEEKERK